MTSFQEKIVFYFAGLLISTMLISLGIYLWDKPILDKHAPRPEEMIAYDLRELHNRLTLPEGQEDLWSANVLATKKFVHTEHLQHHESQKKLGAELSAGQLNLQDAIARLDAEDANMAKQRHTLRSQWLTFYETLDINQQQIVKQFIAERLSAHKQPDIHEFSRE